MPSASPLTSTQLRDLAALLAPEPVHHGRVTARLVVADTAPAAGQRGTDAVAKLRVTVPTKWVSPEQDEDGFLSPIHSPYDRDCILPCNADGQVPKLNLLDLVLHPPPSTDTSKPSPAASGPLTMPRRQVFSTAGQNALMLIGGDVLTFAVQLVSGASRIGAKFAFDEVIADDRKAFERYQECDVHIDFVFRAGGC